MNVTVRAERPDDAPAIGRVVEAAFGKRAEALLVELLRASPSFIPELSLVAEADGEIVGHVMVTTAWLEEGADRRPVANLAPLAVDPMCQREGVGSALMRAVIARCDERGEPLVILEGHPSYYPRFGFEHAVPLGIHFTLPAWAPPEAAMVLRLASYDPSFRGNVRYPEPFVLVEDEP